MRRADTTRLGSVGRGYATAMTSSSSASDESVVEVLGRFAEEGWAANHVVRPDAEMKCGHCARQTPVDRLDVDALHRVEGASDPDDMQLVVGMTCPHCSTRGALVIAFGPSASDTDAEFLVDLDLDGRADPVAADPRDDGDGTAE